MAKGSNCKTIHFAFVYVASLEGAFVFKGFYEIFIRGYFE